MMKRSDNGINVMIKCLIGLFILIGTSANGMQKALEEKNWHYVSMLVWGATSRPELQVSLNELKSTLVDLNQSNHTNNYLLEVLLFKAVTKEGDMDGYLETRRSNVRYVLRELIACNKINPDQTNNGIRIDIILDQKCPKGSQQYSYMLRTLRTPSFFAHFKLPIIGVFTFAGLCALYCWLPDYDESQDQELNDETDSDRLRLKKDPQ